MEQTLIAVPLITGVTQILKSFIPEKFIRLIALILGISYATATTAIFNPDVVIYGVTLGLASSGLYDVAKIDTPKEIRKPVVEIASKVKSIITK